MGLELEPVIISSERRLGCRVKDFYFGLDHQGIDAAYLQAKVNIGDVISQVNGKSLLSHKFDDILELLRTIKNSSRIIVFKNISASCKSNADCLTTCPFIDIPCKQNFSSRTYSLFSLSFGLLYNLIVKNRER